MKYDTVDVHIGLKVDWFNGKVVLKSRFKHFLQIYKKGFTLNVHCLSSRVRIGGKSEI